MKVQRLTPLPGPTTLGEQLETFTPATMPTPGGRPFVYTNFAVTLDGRATIEGRSGPIGSEVDTALLVALRERCDALMIGAGTLRAERYGRVPPAERSRTRRQRQGLAPDPLVVVVSARLDIPWDAGLFTDGGGRVLIVTASTEPVPDTATPVEVMRFDEVVDLGVMMNRLRSEHGIRSVLSEGGPRLHGTLIADELVDELFVTIAPVLSGGDGPRLTELLAEARRELDLLWLLEAAGELFARYRVCRP